MMTPRFINRTALVFWMAALVIAVQAKADPGNVMRDRSKNLVQNEEERYVLITGSNIPQRVKVRSIGTDTPYNIRIYTREELLSTGRQTVAGALALDPSIQISHGH